MDSSGEGVADTTSSSEETPVVREFTLGQLAGRHLIVGIPTRNDSVPVKWIGQTSWLTQTFAGAGANLDMEKCADCSQPDWARNAVATKFLEKTPGTALLFIDDDIIWTVDDVLRVMLLGGDAASGKDVICGFYGTRRDDKPTLYAVFELDENGRPIRCEETGFYKMKKAGTGFMLIKRHVLEAIAAQSERYIDSNGVEQIQIFHYRIASTGHMIGEDYGFCDDARALGFTVWGDPGVRLLHRGTKDYPVPMQNIKD